ncbi:MAG: helix-turn-helix transcriptional regulator [Lachnospira sp.]
MKIYKIEDSGHRIKSYRKKMKMTQEELADKLGISREYLGRIERGQNGISIDLAIIMSDVFQVSVEKVLAIDTGKSKLVNELSDAIIKVLDENNLFTKYSEMRTHSS